VTVKSNRASILISLMMVVTPEFSAILGRQPGKSWLVSNEKDFGRTGFSPSRGMS
jgi:hypothetical protein